MVFNGLTQKALTEPRTDKVQFFHMAWKREDIPLRLAILRTSETIIERKSVNNRSSHPEVLSKRYLKICSKFTGEHPCRSVILIKLQSNLLQIFRTPFSKNISGWLLLQSGPWSYPRQKLTWRAHINTIGTKTAKNVTIFSFCTPWLFIGTVMQIMQIEKALINDRLRVWKVPWKIRIPIIDNFGVIYPWNLLIS